MVLIKPVSANIDPATPLETEEYEGLVVNNLDPLMLGRVQVSYAMVEDSPDDSLPWCYPSTNTFLGNSKNSIMFAVPEVGSTVKVYFPTGDLYMPYYKASEYNADNMCTFFADEDYPNVYGFKDSRGNFVRINKVKDTITLQHSSTCNCFIDSDGSIRVTLPDGSFFEMNVGGSWTLSAGAQATSVLSAGSDGNVTLDCQSFTVNANQAVMNTPITTCKGSLIVEKADGGMIPSPAGTTTVAGGIITSINVG